MKSLSQKLNVGFLTILLILRLFTTTSASDANIDYIKTSCNSTLYKSLCFISLSPFAASIRSNPQKLATTALNLSLNAAESAASFVKTVPRRSHRALSPREAAAVGDCVEEMGDSVSELRDSIKELDNISSSRDGVSRFELVMSDVQTWVSAALTDDDTCMDGFNGGSSGPGGAGQAVKGAVKKMVRRCVVRVAQMTSNALALINMFASTRRN